LTMIIILFFIAIIEDIICIGQSITWSVCICWEDVVVFRFVLIDMLSWKQNQCIEEKIGDITVREVLE